MLRKMTAEENVKFNIGWNSFQSHLEETSKELYTGGHFADCTLVSDDMIPTQAHKIVLSSASIVFKQLLMLNPNSNTNPVLFLKGVKHEELKSILQFIYCGETHVHKDRFDKFILATNDLDIKGLSRSFDNYWPINPGGWSKQTSGTNVTVNIQPSVEIQEGNNTLASLINLDTKEIIKCKEVKNEKNPGGSTINLDSFNLEIGDTYSQTSGDATIAVGNKNTNTNPVSGGGGTRSQCPKCLETFSRKENMIRHYQSRHEGVKHPCQHCGKWFSSRRSYKFHLRTKH